jgi:regulatory protein
MERTGLSKQQRTDLDYKAALQRAAALCSRQEQCTSHIRHKLREWNVNDRDAENILKKLHQEKFLDDKRYATYFVRDKFRLNHWGKVKISHILRQKGIDENTLFTALDQIDEDSYLETCVELIRNKSASLKEKNHYTKRGKLFRFASGRGFESDMIHRALQIIGQG